MQPKAFNSLVSCRNLPIPYPNWNVYNQVGLKHLTSLLFELIHLRQCRFNQNFQNYLNPVCSCNLEPESVVHLFLYWRCYSTIHTELMSDFKEIKENAEPLCQFVSFVTYLRWCKIQIDMELEMEKFNWIRLSWCRSTNSN